MRVALAPVNPTIGDLPGNAALIERAVRTSGDVDLVVLPELAVCGYPPRDLLYERGFVAACYERAMSLASLSASGPTIVVGCPIHIGQGVRNGLLVFQEGKLAATYAKRLLPTYDVFDEDRYFVAGDATCVVEVGGERVGLAICEDLWMGDDAGQHWRYQDKADPVAALAAAGASVIVAPSASPFVEGKHERHLALVGEHAKRHGLWVLGVNQSGANDDLIFDGHAIAFDPTGTLRAAGPRMGNGPTIVELSEGAPEAHDSMIEAGRDVALGEALAVGVRDYVRKTGFGRVLIGLSGGIDSAVACAVSVRALGPDNVLGVAMPGPYSSDHALADAKALAANLGVELVELPIAAPMEGFRSAVDGVFERLGEPALGAAQPDVTEQNLQSRIRGTSIMTLSNRLNALVVTTGNKTELAVGYCTLYGDMNGAIAPLADLPKMRVYELARAMNAKPDAFGFDRPPIPESTISKPPSAELAPDQRDDDTLPPYDLLDEIVVMRVEQRLGVAEIAAETGCDEGTVRRMCRLIAIHEYKRRQYGVALKMTPVAFGPGRRMPIAQAWMGEPRREAP
ncbi:MAG: NAD+ synthase [Phycisphaerales bacterium]|jgi:NAD+ synthase (glutamine-hydrolysing)